MKRRAADVRRKRLEKVAVAERSAMKRVLNDVHRQQWEKQRSADPVHHLRRGVRRNGRGVKSLDTLFFGRPVRVFRTPERTNIDGVFAAVCRILAIFAKICRSAIGTIPGER